MWFYPFLYGYLIEYVSDKWLGIFDLHPKLYLSSPAVFLLNAPRLGFLHMQVSSERPCQYDNFYRFESEWRRRCTSDRMGRVVVRPKSWLVNPYAAISFITQARSVANPCLPPSNYPPLWWSEIAVELCPFIPADHHDRQHRSVILKSASNNDEVVKS